MPAWEEVDGDILNQGDLFDSVAIPSFGPDFPSPDQNGQVQIVTQDHRIIVLSQSCDLEQKKLTSVVVASVYTLDEFERTNPNYKTKGQWTPVALGRLEALHMLFGPGGEDDSRKCLVVDFRTLATLPIAYLKRIAAGVGRRQRLTSPYIENLSQALARFFMRVALPKDLPRTF
jgi:hypothetical protein